MKINIQISHEYNSVFLDVARIIAQGNPPQWLPIALQHFSSGIGEGPLDFDWVVKKMSDAVDTLLRYLPVFEHMGPIAGEAEDRATMVLLEGIKKDLERATRKGTGRRPDVGKLICAAVMIEASKLAKGNVEPHSLEFREAVADYWKACGGEEVGAEGDPGNWRRPIEIAIAMDRDRDWIREILTAIVQNAP